MISLNHGLGTTPFERSQIKNALFELEHRQIYNWYSSSDSVLGGKCDNLQPIYCSPSATTEALQGKISQQVFLLYNETAFPEPFNFICRTAVLIACCSLTCI